MRAALLSCLLLVACIPTPEKGWRVTLIGEHADINLPTCTWTGLYFSDDGGRCWKEFWNCDDGRDTFMSGIVFCGPRLGRKSYVATDREDAVSGP